MESKTKSKQVEAIKAHLNSDFDYVITVCDHANQHSRAFPVRSIEFTGRSGRPQGQELRNLWPFAAPGMNCENAF